VVDAIKRFHVLGIGVVARLALVIALFRLGVRLRYQRDRSCRRASAHTERTENIPAINFGFAVLFHRLSSLMTHILPGAAHNGSAKASFSISTTAGPTVTTLR